PHTSHALVPGPVRVPRQRLRQPIRLPAAPRDHLPQARDDADPHPPQRAGPALPHRAGRAVVRRAALPGEGGSLRPLPGGEPRPVTHRAARPAHRAAAVDRRLVRRAPVAVWHKSARNLLAESEYGPKRRSTAKIGPAGPAGRANGTIPRGGYTHAWLFVCSGADRRPET